LAIRKKRVSGALQFLFDFRLGERRKRLERLTVGWID
jgi:hypothetical protein